MKKVSTRAEFIGAIESLLQEIDESWEISGLSGIDFLERVQAYASDLQIYYDNQNVKEDADQASWSNFATLLLGACNYE